VAQLALRRLRAIEARAEGRPVPRACPSSKGAVQATHRQLRITHRISVVALRLHARLSGELLGRRVRVPAATLRLTGRSNTPASRREVQRAERIAQAALRRANALSAALRRR
jgi:hypothetical protein